MQSTYRIIWTEPALEELQQAVEYLELNFSEKEIRNLAQELEETLRHISINPKLFQTLETNNQIHRVVVSRFNTLYYHIIGKNIEILSFFSNRQSPEKRKL